MQFDFSEEPNVIRRLTVHYKADQKLIEFWVDDNLEVENLDVSHRDNALSFGSLQHSQGFSRMTKSLQYPQLRRG